MDTNTWIAIGSLALAVNVVTVGCAVWIVRAVGKAIAAAPAAVRSHEHDCANYEPNTSVQMQALGGD